MAKKALKRPELPAGRRLDLFLYLQDQVLRNGDKPVAELARDIGVSHQAIYKALTGPRVPSRTVVHDLATYLGRPGSPQLVGEVMELWAFAVAEERGAISSSPKKAILALLQKRLNELRNESNMTISHIAKKASIGRTSVYDTFAGRAYPSERNLSAMFDVFGVHSAEKEGWIRMLGEVEGSLSS